MAIFNMSDSSINDYLNENDAIKRVSDNHGPEVGKKLKSQLSDVRDYAKKMSDNDLKAFNNIAKKDKPISAYARHAESDKEKYIGKKIDKKVSGVIGSELKKRGFDPKTGDKLREAAEYILSVLDEID